MKKILMLLALAGVTSVASAQQTTITDTKLSRYKTNIK